MTHHRRLGARIAALSMMLVALGWIAMIIAVLVVGWRDDIVGERRQSSHADAIVVLGAAHYDGRPSPVLRARLDHALALWRLGIAPVVIVTGGTAMGDTTSEAMVGRRYLRQHGVPDSALLLEQKGLTTSQSLHAVAAMADGLPGRTVVVVSDPFHMLRLTILARRLGLQPLTSPTRTSPISSSPARWWKYVLAESVKVPVAFLTERTAD
jgi:uncharacterized SAM-binding protein YcdF (DUF218 family)